MKLPTKNIILKITSVIFAFLVFAPNLASAHQPRITESRLTEVPMPEISKAYYGKLTGEPDVYIIKSDKSFDLYVNVLVPDISGQKKDVSAVILKNDTEQASLNGAGFEWKQFYEPFGADKYWKGPEYKSRVEAGIYEIRVSSPKNDSKYSLAIGEIEAFDSKESLNALTIIPELKKDFFSTSPISFIASPLGFGLIAIMYVLAFIFGFIYRTILKRFAKNSPRGVTQNIGKKDRLLRVTIGVALLLWAISTSWSPILIFFSGFAMFEAIFSWCGFYAALGKNTCPID
jgi:hypothetical protein